MNEKRALARVLRPVAAAGPLLFFAIATVEGGLRPGYDPVAQPISALAIGPRGWIQELNFFILTVSLLSFALVLRKELSHRVGARVAPGILFLMAFGVALAGLFRMDPIGAPPTLVGQIHMIAGFLVFPWMPAVMLLVARRFRKDARFRPYFTYTLGTGLFCLGTMAFFLLFVGPPGAPGRLFPGLVGLVQRLQLLPFLTWIAIIAARATHDANFPSAARSAAVS